MSQEEVRKTFSQNLQRYMRERGVTQNDLISSLGIQSASISSWVNGKYLPRMSKIQMLCDYFHIEPSDLLTNKVPDPSAQEQYFLDMYRRLDEYGKRMVELVARQELERINHES